METVKLGNVAVEVDSEKTRELYAKISKGGSEQCGCAYCRNYRAQLPNPLPREVMLFLEQCGIDPSKDAEVYEMGEIESGGVCYGGEYYFVCTKEPEVDDGELPNGFKFSITQPSPLQPDEFSNTIGSKCFNFVYEQMPWVLNERL